MNIIDLRTSLEHSSTLKRISDRRQVPYTFGSPEWLEYMQKNNLPCPKEDRRKGARRSADLGEQPVESSHANNPYHRIVLSPAERTLLEDLYLMDLDNF